MAETLFTIAGWALLIGGVFVAWRFGWRDAEKGTRRCPKCWYDLGATAGLQCPECGNAVAKESKLLRSRRKWRWIATGCVLLLASYPVFKWPLYQAHGAIGFVPRLATLAFLPEVSTVLRRYGPQRARFGDLLARQIAQSEPLNRIERYALARSWRRVLFARSWTVTGIGSPGISVELLGDQAGEIVDPLIELLSDGESRDEAICLASSLPRVRDERFRRLIGPVRALAEDTSIRMTASGCLTQRVNWWGGSRQDCRIVAAGVLRGIKPHEFATADLEFSWRNGSVPAQDLCAIQRHLVSQAPQLSNAGAHCLANLGIAAAPVIDEIISSAQRPPSILVNVFAMPLMAMGKHAQSGLPWLDRLSSHRNPLIASSATLAALSIRGEADAAYAYWLACIESDTEVDPDAPPHQWMTPLILYADVPAEWKAEGLVLAIERDRRFAAGRAVGAGVSGGVAIAVDCLGVLGGEAVTAVPTLIGLIEPGTPEFFVERLIDTLTRIRSEAEFDTQPVEAAVGRWSAGSPYRDGTQAALSDLRNAASGRRR